MTQLVIDKYSYYLIECIRFVNITYDRHDAPTPFIAYCNRRVVHSSNFPTISRISESRYREKEDVTMITTSLTLFDHM